MDLSPQIIVLCSLERADKRLPVCETAFVTIEILSEGDRMAKGRPAKKEPSAWDTACEVTNTVLEVAKVHCPT